MLRLAPKKPETKDKEKIGRVDIKQATRVIQEIIQEPTELGEEEAARNKEILENAMAGIPSARTQLINIILALFEQYGIEVEGMEPKIAAYEIYKYAWGLGPLEELYYDPGVNEIQVNAPDAIYIIKNLRYMKANVRFRDNEHVMKVITRMIMHDRGVALNKSSPTVESMRKDGTRITATCPPASENVTLVLRRPSSNVMTPEDLMKSATLDEKTWQVLKTLVRGRANILIAGGVGSGKTTILRTLISVTHPSMRIIVLETDRELFLRKNFPDRNIVELEEHPEIGRTLENLFRTCLRYSPTIIVVGEFRGSGEAKEAVRACIRGHDGSMATGHFGSPQEAIEGTARLLLDEGLNLPPEMAVANVASAYNVVVQMFGDSNRGAIKVESVTEVEIVNNKVGYRDLVRWTPAGDDYLEGSWKVCGKPGQRLMARLKRYLPASELRDMGWI